MSGILSSFNIGVSGMSAMGSAMGVVGDNIANAGTRGFKSSRAQFQDVLATTLRGIDGGDQLGAGTKLGHVTPVFTQGNITRTESVTDLAVSGNGFFKVKAPFGEAFTRDGSFHFDKDGNMINGEGYKVQGFQADDAGKMTNKVGDIRLGNISVPAAATKTVNIAMNLDSTSKIKEFDIKNPEKTSNYNNSMTVYDNVGTARLLTMYFNKTGDNSWTYRAVIDGKDAAGGEPGIPQVVGQQTVRFNDKGVLLEESDEPIAFDFNNGAAPGQEIRFDFGNSLTDGGDGSDASTQFGTDSTISRHTQDGTSAGTLKSLSFNDGGILTAVYDNGSTRDVAQIAVAKFENNEGLFKMGKNLFKESRKSGQAALGRSNEGGRGEVLAKSVELSNVDIATEFVEMMKTQRNFQANTRTITTADRMLEEIINIKR